MENPFYPWIPKDWYIREPPNIVLHHGKLYVDGKVPDEEYKEQIVLKPEDFWIVRKV